MSKLGRGLTLSVAAGVVLYVAAAAWLGWDQVRASLATFVWWNALGGLGLACSNYGIRFLKWEYLLRRLGIAVPRGRSLGIFLSGFALTVTPGKVGEVLKAYLLRESDGVPMARSAPIVIGERVTDLIGCLLLMIGGIAAFGSSREVVWTAGAGVFLVLVLVAAVSSRRFGEWAIGVFEKVLGRVPLVGKLGPKLREFHAATREVLAPGPLLVGTVISVFAWASECAAFWLVIEGFPGARCGILLATFIYASTTVAGALSFLPGGIGVQETGMIALLVKTIRIDDQTALAMTFITRICTLWFAVLVGAVALSIVRRQVRVDLAAVSALRE